MWELIDMKTETFNAGCSVDFDKYYLISNGKTEKWVDAYDYYDMKSEGLIKPRK